MTTVNMHQAKSQLSKLVEAVESGAESEVVIARNGKPAVKIVPVDAGKAAKRRLGLFDHLGVEGMATLEEFNALDAEIERMFNESAERSLFPGEDDESAA